MSVFGRRMKRDDRVGQRGRRERLRNGPILLLAQRQAAIMAPTLAEYFAVWEPRPTRCGRSAVWISGIWAFNRPYRSTCGRPALDVNQNRCWKKTKTDECAVGVSFDSGSRRDVVSGKANRSKRIGSHRPDHRSLFCSLRRIVQIWHRAWYVRKDTRSNGGVSKWPAAFRSFVTRSNT